MKLLSTVVLIFFTFALVFDCYFIITNNDDLRFISKGLMMPLLLIFFVTETQYSASKASKALIFISLLSSFAGDLLLLFEHVHIYFIIGLAAFLITHILYTIFFLRIQPFDKSKGIIIFISGFIVVAYIIFITKIIWNGVSKNDLEVPVILYIMAISLMLISAINTTAGKVRKVAFSNFIPGAILFVVSDSLLAINKFAVPLENAAVLIMISYAVAQFLIVSGSIKILKKQKSRSKKRRSGSVSE